MFKCLIVTPDLFLKQGVSTLIRESLIDFNFKGEPEFNHSVSAYADAIFIDTDAVHFYQSLEEVVRFNRAVEIFVICHEKENRLMLSSIRKDISNIIYREEGVESIKQKIASVLQRGFHLDSPLSLRRNEKISSYTSSHYNETLTTNEHEVMKLFVRGFSGKSIAQILRKSEKTVSTQKRSVMNKLGVKSNQELLRKMTSI
ncbi:MULTISPECIES: helix-turn-helix transcriptional regulator [Serratia]|uniref:LuxR C-terminal-related transcriptional regulator n=1 Tax=Serratia fonticola TaxID=47917 RepID=A0AAE7EJE6_SERFO|nr:MULTISPECIES: LuxR C-terminal-related transcriptional regulator [Serratia]QKJ59932.2 LuxR C-terminal-related transcriptional regulator [Serratia fonticola]